MPRADWNYISELKIYIPPIEEQKSITKVFDTIEKEINLLASEVKALKN